MSVPSEPESNEWREPNHRWLTPKETGQIDDGIKRAGKLLGKKITARSLSTYYKEAHATIPPFITDKIHSIAINGGTESDTSSLAAATECGLVVGYMFGRYLPLAPVQHQQYQRTVLENLDWAQSLAGNEYGVEDLVVAQDGIGNRVFDALPHEVLEFRPGSSDYRKQAVFIGSIAYMGTNAVGAMVALKVWAHSPHDRHEIERLEREISNEDQIFLHNYPELPNL